jgi:ferredoxin
MGNARKSMEMELYRKLARHLDELPGGYPATDSGVEIRILQQLFTPEEAKVALHLSLVSEEARVVALRAGLPVEAVTAILEGMERKGLLFASHDPGEPVRYMALQFVVGIWEFQVGRLTPELVKDFEEYLPVLFDAEAWRKAPQLRTVPVQEAIDSDLEILSYEKAEELVAAHDSFTVTPCICRSEMRLEGKGCDKPLETCLSFGSSADFYQMSGAGRAITREEAMEVLKKADKAGLVLSPGNAKDASFICACCGCCCGVLRSLKFQENPAELVSTPFVARVRTQECIGCRKCISRCQMDALAMEGRKVRLDPGRCIGCGLCVTTCPTRCIDLVRKPEAEQPFIPKTIVGTTIRLGKARGKLSNMKLVRMVLRSRIDRLRAPKLGRRGRTDEGQEN